MNREAELLKLAKTTRTFKIPGGIRREFLLDEAELNSLIDRLVIEGRISEIQLSLDKPYEAELRLDELLSQSSQPLADSSNPEEAKQ